MDQQTYKNLKTASAETKLKVLHVLLREIGDSIDNSVQQMTYAMDMASSVNSWIEKWDEQTYSVHSIDDEDCNDSKKLATQTVTMLSSLQSMSGHLDKMWLKSRQLKKIFNK